MGNVEEQNLKRTSSLAGVHVRRDLNHLTGAPALSKNPPRVVCKKSGPHVRTSRSAATSDVGGVDATTHHSFDAYCPPYRLHRTVQNFSYHIPDRRHSHPPIIFNSFWFPQSVPLKCWYCCTGPIFFNIST